MTAQEVVESFQAALSQGDVPKAFSFFADEAQWHQPGNNQFSGTRNTVGEIGNLLASMMEVSQGTLVIKPAGPLMVNSQLVCAPVRFIGKNGAKDMDMMGIDLFEIHKGKITQVWLFSENQPGEDDFWGK